MREVDILGMTVVNHMDGDVAIRQIQIVTQKIIRNASPNLDHAQNEIES